YLYALGAAGERGVDRVLEWFRADIVRTMSLLGAANVRELGPALLDHRGGSAAPTGRTCGRAER
ncbi:MAG TPA: alpha-hydroxy-acid oxidizing protein, partial [Acidimicrobiales bacterium]|nr:alpha-hydroxy-acid oxidizing protein [Acidimicrobiales bacterium]